MSHFNRCPMAFTLSLLLGFVTLVGQGCSRKPDSDVATRNDQRTAENTGQASGGVATINVNRIADESGSLTEINRQLDQKEAEFKLILDGLKKIQRDALATKAKEFGDNPTPEQQKELTALKNRQMAEYNAKWQETRIQLAAIKQKLDQAFLERLQPITREVAASEGMSVVIRTENVFCNVDSFDITNKVSEKFQAKYPRETRKTEIRVAEVPSRGGSFVPRK